MTERTQESPSMSMDEKRTREAWRVFQIMSEFVDGFEKLECIHPAVSIFGSARTPEEHPWYQKTVEIAHKLSDSGFSVVSGGGPGIMEAANRGAQMGKSDSIGVNIVLPHEQKGNDYQDISLDFKYFFARKVMFVKHAAAYVVMPGGFGTIDEFAEILTLIQTGKSRRIPIILVERDFWKGLIEWFDTTLNGHGTISPEDLDLIQMIDDPREVVEAIFQFYEGRTIEPLPQEHELLLQL
ncbi:MAG: TIGR00730 family Rossman fold protein [Chromatiales bacterium]